MSDSGQNEPQQNNEKITEQDVKTAIDNIEKKIVEHPEILERLINTPEAMTIIQHRFSMFEGPLPPPSLLEGYERILPGSAERIFLLTEKEQTHRHLTDNEILKGNIGRDKRGQWMGFSITIFILIIAAYFAAQGNTLFAGTLIGIDLLGLVAVFVLGRRLTDKD